jgi:hypothetical protein
MDPGWLSAGFSAACALVMTGVYVQTTREHGRRLAAHDKKFETVETQIGETDRLLANTRGQLGLNGS